MANWPEPVERVAAFLRAAGTEARIEQFPEGTPTAQEAANAVGCELRQIVKSLVFTCGERVLLVLVPGDRRADADKVASAGGCAKARVAGPELVLEATGFEPGAVAPFPVRQIDRVFVERSLLALDQVWIGAGSTRHMAALAPADLVRLARAEPLDAVEDPDRTRG
jgi:prolyl-tRNA editing enzyme YbaK/EbsC (Cys-tRNA(Pro) deacylase)